MNKNIPSHLYMKFINDETNKLPVVLANHRFWWIGDAGESGVEVAMIYDGRTRLLWDAKPNSDIKIQLQEGKLQASKLKIGDLDGWSLPKKKEITEFASALGCPLQNGIAFRLLQNYSWLTVVGGIDLDTGCWDQDSATSGSMLAVNECAKTKSAVEFIDMAVQRQWTLRACDNENSENILAIRSKYPDLKEIFQSIDHTSARLPVLEPAQFSDPNKGLWELWKMDTATLEKQGVRGRNPAVDVKDCNVAIDFGTSSTVVAYEDNGQHKLLRIGISDFWRKEQPDDYENPTILEFIDFPQLLKAWQTEAYRPGVQWDQVRCSHEALDRFRNNGSDISIVASMLTNLKQWALRQADDNTVRITDQINKIEHELAPLSLRMPVRGQPLEVTNNDVFDPIELYAWFLGLTINWRGRGIFLRYYMTFPVAYPKDVKEKILASFRRGLQRSLPETLVAQPIFEQFTVEERASEPTAYAAIALQQLAIMPTTEGVAYGVFDFGGGTVDFDFGYYRLPDADETDAEWEQVLEHFGAAGDRFLGGENLLENMAYMVFLHNIDICREKKISFTRPMDADDFAGSEMFLEKSQAATTNTLMLMACLRPLWETGQGTNSTDMAALLLQTREGSSVSCQLAIPKEALQLYLESRIDQGIRNFFAAMKKAFSDKLPPIIHVLLAGNASRSEMVAGFFGLMGNNPEGNARHDRTIAYFAQLFGITCPEIIPYKPMSVNEKNVYQPTGKTGVALGLLHLCPGGVIKVINRSAQESEGEAPFAHYVGRIRQGKFHVGINQGERYGQWRELGVPRERVFKLIHSQSPKAHTGEMSAGEPDLHQTLLRLAGDTDGQKVFARAIGPAEIEICTALSTVAIESGDYDNVQALKLG